MIKIGLCCTAYSTFSIWGADVSPSKVTLLQTVDLDSDWTRIVSKREMD